MRKTLIASALVLALAASAHAGDMQYPVAPPPPQSSAVAGDGTVNTPQAFEETASADAVTEAMLTLLSGVLALF